MMLRDRNGRVIGKIVETSDGVLRVYDEYGRLAGTYYAKDNKTYDAFGRYFGEGNLLTMCLGRD